MSGRLQGKTAVITGTGGGQGRVAALRFAAEGARVLGCDLKAEDSEETVRLVRAAGGEMESLHPLDLSDEGAVQQLMGTARELFGGLDILYNNAGGVRLGTIEGTSKEDFEFTLTNELTIVFLAVKHALPLFRERGGGSIVNTASIAGVRGGWSIAGNLPGLFAHCVSKAGLIRMTEVMAVELAPLGIRVNTISPGAILTPGTEPFLGDPEVGAAFEASALVPRVGEPDDIVNAAVYLASDEATFATGSNFVIDGGWVASGGGGVADPEVQAAVDRALPGFLRYSNA